MHVRKDRTLDTALASHRCFAFTAQFPRAFRAPEAVPNLLRQATARHAINTLTCQVSVLAYSYLAYLSVAWLAKGEVLIGVLS